MQPDLRKLICEHIIRVLQHQKDVNQKQHICVKHDFVSYAAYCAPFDENRGYLMIQNANAVLRSMHRQFGLHVALIFFRRKREREEEKKKGKGARCHRVLITRFEKAVPLSTRLQLFSSCIQGSSESVQEFAARINKLGTQIFHSSNTAQNTAVRNANDQLLQSRLIKGLRNDIRRFVLARDPINLEESINAALIEEQNVKLNQIANDERSGLSPSQTETSVISALTNKLQEINLRVERLQEASSVTVRKTGGDPFSRRETVFKCFYFGFQGHRQAKCRKKRMHERRTNYQPPHGETPRANFLFSVTQALILSIGDMSISKNRLFAIITQPPGIQRAGHTRLLGIGVSNATLETTI
ncbi:hypothetical protein TNCV_2403181 [Trichonephila clavipes]|uniref:Uncharacterized protein n=1 Tax=Trichonephila clavipes TaxID=2585209 RepID=A0A8X6RAD7_TRICX|nr:hypothetical protein TNCV_2403181 [Trichonephila clavipes]